MSSEQSVKGYAPLPQSISNTDTEDDDDEHPHNADSASKDDDQSRISDTTTICQNGRFYPLDETKNIGRVRNGRNSFSYSNDNIPIMVLDGQSHDDLWKRHDMSPLRRFCLAASVLLCILTILVFLYVLPCDNSSICLSSTPEPKTSVSWDRTLDGIELHGKITVIKGNPYNLIFLIRGQQFGDIESKDAIRKRQIPQEGGGVLSMLATNGNFLWWVKLKRLPMNINCEMLDTDGSGKPDCLVSGNGGLLVSIDPVAGTIHWNSETYTHSDLPLLISDVNFDGINDLLSVESRNTSQNLVILSGKEGKLLGRREISGCPSIKLNKIDTPLILSYTCYNENHYHLVQTMPLIGFIKSLDLSQPHRKFPLVPLTPKALAPAYPNQTSADSWDLTPHLRLYVRNVAGDGCPGDDCRSSVNLTLHRIGGNESRIWDHVSASSFVTRPAILDTTGQAYTAGFALKFWNWTSDFNAEHKKDQSTSVYQQNLTERVSIVYVNNTQVHMMNASQNDVVQLCRGEDCQPSLPRQVHSLLITDLNDDGIMELISYRSSYTIPENKDKFDLFSKVQVVKLDAVF